MILWIVKLNGPFASADPLGKGMQTAKIRAAKFW